MLQKMGLQKGALSKPPSANALLCQLKPNNAFKLHELDFCTLNAVEDARRIISDYSLPQKSNGCIDLALASVVLSPNAQNDSNMEDHLVDEWLGSYISEKSDATSQSFINGLDSGWNRMWSERVKKCLQYIPLYRNELLLFCKTLTSGGTLLLVINATGLELLFGILGKINPLFMEKPVPIFPHSKFIASPLFSILWRNVRYMFMCLCIVCYNKFNICSYS